VVKHLKGRDALINDLGGYVNVESDCGGDSTGAWDETSNTKEETEEPTEEETRVALITGSFAACVRDPVSSSHRGNDEFSSWKSLFFYRCTDVIFFAPLKSQGVESRLNHIREKTVATAPPPCSPKSIYILASLVRQPSFGCLAHGIDPSSQARDPAPLR
jgi:hypothetical protein